MTAATVEPSPAGVPGAVTDPSALVAEELTYAGVGGTQINGYLARPANADSYPGVIVIHEAHGLNEHIRDVSNRIANLGYVALGVDLYTREGGPPPMGDLPALMQRLFAMQDATVLGDLEGAADHLRARDDVTGKVGCIGFCMGGRYTLLFACASDRPTPPLELADKLSCPLLAAVGAEDQNPSPQLAEQLREHAAASGQEVKVDVYEDAGHAFFADYRPNYRPAAAAKLWGEIVPFLQRNLQGG
jgi:carboxymethylenebutenolidase